MAPSSRPGADLWIANSVADLVQGDVREHLPLEKISLDGDVLGLGTTTSIDNGELSFLLGPNGRTTIWKGQSFDGGIRQLRAGDGSGHFPYVCFSRDASALRTPVELALLGPTRRQPLQELVAKAISLMRERGELPEAPIYGLRLLTRWHSLIITVASKLCMGQQRRNASMSRTNTRQATAEPSIYQLLQHYRLAAEPTDATDDPIHFLGPSLQWDCCGFWDSEPTTGRLTVPVAGEHLHLHGCSTDLRHGGHLHHQHEQTVLEELERLVLYPIQRVEQLSSDLTIEDLNYNNGTASFRVCNRGAMDVSEVGVAVVIDNRYDSHRYLRLPWLSGGESEAFHLDIPLDCGPHRLEVIADPEQDVLEEASHRQNNKMQIDLMISQ